MQCQRYPRIWGHVHFDDRSGIRFLACGKRYLHIFYPRSVAHISRVNGASIFSAHEALSTFLMLDSTRVRRVGFSGLVRVNDLSTFVA
jgi:hypothetical protein